jgi:hypothetical protein
MTDASNMQGNNVLRLLCFRCVPVPRRRTHTFREVHTVKGGVVHMHVYIYSLQEKSAASTCSLNHWRRNELEIAQQDGEKENKAKHSTHTHRRKKKPVERIRTCTRAWKRKKERKESEILASVRVRV